MRAIAVRLTLAALAAVAASGQTPAEENVERVFHFAHVSAVQEFQEIATTIRSTMDIRQLAVDAASRSLAMRGTAVQVAVAEWLFNELDRPATRQADAAVREYRLPGADDVVRLFFLAHAETQPELQEVAVLLRSIGDIRRLFTYTALKAVTLRGTAAQAALAEWLVKELDKPANTQAGTPPREYRLPGVGENEVRIFYLVHAPTPQRLQEIATQARAMTQIRRLFALNAQKAVAVRGTADQVAMAARLIQEWDR